MLSHQPTPDEVLSILKDENRHSAKNNPEVDLTDFSFATSCQEWMDTNNLLPWFQLGQYLNREWGMSLSLEEWQRLLNDLTLLELCETISHHAQIETLPKIGWLGCDSGEGRAMRALHEVLLKLGVPRHEIRPSTPLTPLLSKYGCCLLQPCIRLAPGALPAMELVGIIRKILVSTVVLAWLSLFVGILQKQFDLSLWSFAMGLASYLLLWIPHPIFQGSLILPGLNTLGDLATCLGKGIKTTSRP